MFPFKYFRDFKSFLSSLSEIWIELDMFLLYFAYYFIVFYTVCGKWVTSLGEESSWHSGGLYRSSYTPHKPTAMPHYLGCSRCFVIWVYQENKSLRTQGTLVLLFNAQALLYNTVSSFGPSSTRKITNSSKLINTRMSEYSLSPGGEVDESQIL